MSLWVAMITSEEPGRTPWDGDIKLTAFTAAGLQQTSIIRPAKLAAIDARVATKIGHIPSEQLQKVLAFIAATLGIP